MIGGLVYQSSPTIGFLLAHIDAHAIDAAQRLKDTVTAADAWVDVHRIQTLEQMLADALYWRRRQPCWIISRRRSFLIA